MREESHPTVGSDQKECCSTDPHQAYNGDDSADYRRQIELFVAVELSHLHDPVFWSFWTLMRVLMWVQLFRQFSSPFLAAVAVVDAVVAWVFLILKTIKAQRCNGESK